MSRSPSHPSRPEGAQATPLWAVVLALAGLVLVAVAQVASAMVDRSRAATAADAAALAGAAAGRDEAVSIAARNDGRLLEWQERGDIVEVVVAVGDRAATARASRQVSVGGVDGLDQRLQRALRRIERLLGRPVPITSGFRSRADQQRLWDRRHQNPFPVARPGTSMHERGLAVDVAPEFVPAMRAVMGRVGLCQPLPVTDRIHFEWCGGG